MFDKTLYEEIKTKTREINKMKHIDQRVDATVEYKNSIYAKIADELDELFSNINLKKNKDENE